MRWFTDAGVRFWQAYCEGLEMSCPVHNRMADALAERICERDRNHDVTNRNDGQQSSTLH